MYPILRALFAGLTLFFLPLVALGQINVSVPNGGGSVTIDQPGTDPTITCPPDCVTVSFVSDPLDSTFIFTANPQPGWQLAGWIVDSLPQPPTPTVSLGPFVSSPFGTVQANFDKILTVTVNGTGAGQVTSDDGFIVCGSGSTCQQAYPPTQTTAVVLTATPAPGSVFVGWNQPGPGNACTDPLLANCSLDPSGTGFGALPNGVTATFDILDSDGDGVGDASDLCPGTPPATPVDATGCPLATDSDGDGVLDASDQCPATPAGEIVNVVGCAASQLDGDFDGVTDDVDLCPNTRPGTPVDADGCADSQLDSDGDGVDNAADQCPATPDGEAVDGDGCGDSQKDSDGDGVTDDVDQCPNTPPGETVDAVGCADTQNDSDGDGVNDAVDACPDTPPGEAVDADGCSTSQTDGDADGVSDAIDICPDTPPGEAADADGCSASQKDADGDGVSDAVDNCPDTPPGETVDGSGCSASQKDTDGDDVSDADDLCPATPPGEIVDSDGCAASELDGDGDGVSNDRDQCPNTPPGVTVVETGCTPEQQEIRDFGPALIEVDGLTGSQRSVAATIDDLCPRLIAADAAGQLNADQQSLRNRCSSLKNSDTSSAQQQTALESITPEDLALRTDLSLEVGRTQVRLVQNRINRIRNGTGQGFSAGDLTLRLAGTDVAMGTLEQAVADAVDGGSDSGGGSDFSDFGNWGFYLQGDIELGERDAQDDAGAYDFDYWLLSAGADYRFGAKGYLGASLNYGSSDSETQFSSSDGDMLGATLYGGFNLGEGGFVDAIVAWLEQDYSLVRDVAYADATGDFAARHFGDTKGSHYSAGLNLGYMFSLGGWRIGPTASILYLDGQVDGYAEQAAAGSSAAWAMTFGENDYGLTSLALGIQADYAWLMDWGVLMPGFRFTFNSDDESTDLRTPLRFVNDPFSDVDVISLSRTARDGEYWESAFSLAGQFSYGISAYASFRLIGARDGFDQTGYTLGLRWDKVF